MKHTRYSQNHSDSQDQKPPPSASPEGVTPFNQNEADFAPTPDEVARRAYFAFENQGSQPGQDVQHWLEAEAELLAERKCTRTHGFDHQT